MTSPSYSRTSPRPETPDQGRLLSQELYEKYAKGQRSYLERQSALSEAQDQAKDAQGHLYKAQGDADDAQERLTTAQRELHKAALDQADAHERLLQHTREKINGVRDDVQDLRTKHGAKHAEHDARHEVMHQRVTDVEKAHHYHSIRLKGLEDKHTDTTKAVAHLSDQQKWMQPAVAALAVIGGAGILWWLVSKLLRRNKSHKGEDETYGDNGWSEGSQRAHARDWQWKSSGGSALGAEGKYSQKSQRRDVVFEEAGDRIDW